MGALKQDIDRLRDLSHGSIPPQERGRRFESLLTRLLANHDPRSSFRPTGEEIDGSFLHHHRTYLLEAKWHKDPIPASSIYAFKGKVDGKLAGTLGVFISMSGYARDAVDALRVGKVLNIVLFNDQDVDAALEHGFGKVLDFKLRLAAERGEVMVPYVARGLGAQAVVLVVETPEDALILLRLASALRRIDPGATLPEIKISQGPIGLPTVAGALSEATDAAVVLVAGSGPYTEHRAAIEQVIGATGRLTLIIADPSIQAWAEAVSPAGADGFARKGVQPAIGRGQLRELAEADAGFRDFARLLGARL